ncbi:MAG: deoxyribonuclease IV [Chthoniobacterales bacterium]
MLLLGSHVPTIGGAAHAFDRAAGIGCTAMQIFVKNNMQWVAKPLEPKDVKSFLHHPLRSKIRVVIAHAGYLINLGVRGSENHKKSLLSLSAELLRCDQLEIPYLVLHPGAHLGAGINEGVRCVIESLNMIHQHLPHLKTTIVLETTAGQGSCLGSRFEEIADILNSVEEPERLRVCLDTAHVFAAGYDIAKNPEKVFSAFDKIIGLDQLCVLHLNDSKTALGSHVDRHEHIGEGKIGLPAFRWIMNAKKLSAIPKILETPKGKDLKEDAAAMKLLRSFVPV